MGGSRRKLKKGKSKVKVGVVKRSKTKKSRLPRAVKGEQPAVEQRLNTAVDWQEGKTLINNYQRNALVLDPNEGFGRNARSAPLKSKEERAEEGKETYSDDDEMRVVCNQPRKTGTAPPKRLTTRQRQIVEQLISEHGDNHEAMFRDTKRNRLQLSVGQLRSMTEAYHYWPPLNSRHDFRAPHKRPKRLY